MKGCGLVLEGGGLRGVFSTGVLDFMMEKKIEFPYVIGVSYGAVNGCSYISKQIGRTKRIVDEFIDDKRYAGINNLIKEKSYFGIQFGYDEIPNNLIPFDFDEFYRSDKTFKIVVTNCITGKPEYLEKNSLSKEILMDAFRASCSLPLISPIVKIEGVPYLDGGLSDSIPVKKANKDGYDKNVIILTRHRSYQKSQSRLKSILKLLYRDYPALVQSMLNRYKVYNETLQLIKKLEDEGRVFVVHPFEELKISRLEKDKAKLEELYKYGYSVMKERYEDLMKWMCD